MAHEHDMYDFDLHFKIDPITRAITSTSAQKITLVQYDHNSEKFTFDMPRHIEGHDMSLCNKVEVHYLNIESGTKFEIEGKYIVYDMQVSQEDEDLVTFSWLISQDATQLHGSLSFFVKFMCVNDNIVEYKWNTAIFPNISVLPGMCNDEAIVECYSDVLEEWTSRLEATAMVDLKQTTVDFEDGGVNVVTATFGDGRTADFIIHNGSKGDPGENFKLLGKYDTYLLLQKALDNGDIDPTPGYSYGVKRSDGRYDVYTLDSDLNFINYGPLNGYTPKRGADYWTEEDEAEIKSYVGKEVVSAIPVVQAEGDSETDIMSQRATTKAIDVEKDRAIARENEIERLFTTPTQEAVDKWLDEHPEATTTVQEASLDIDKFTEEAQKRIVKDYVTPEMFGAKGGDADDSDAIQACIDYAKDNKKCVTFTQNYCIGKSIIVDAKNVWGVRGITIYGSGRQLKVTEITPAVILRGNGNTIYDLEITFDSAFETKDNPYNCALVRLESMKDNETFLCGNTNLINVQCNSPVAYTYTYKYHSIGFEFVLDGEDDEKDAEGKVIKQGQKAYSYRNNFKSCRCRNLGTAIKITTISNSHGCNGNTFDVDAWACDAYLDGRTGGSYFLGCVQASLYKYATEEVDGKTHYTVLNKYLLNRVGDQNVFGNIFYDIAHEKEIEYETDYRYATDNDDKTKQKNRQKLIGTDSYSLNTFVFPVNAYAFDPKAEGYYVNLIGNSITDEYNLPLNVYKDATAYNVTPTIPFRNSFNVITDVSVEYDGIYAYDDYTKWSDAYGELDKNGMPYNMAPLFHDDVVDRGTPYLVCSPNSFLKLRFKNPKASIVGMFILFGNTTGGPDEAILTWYKADGTVKRTQQGIINSRGTGRASVYFPGAYETDDTINNGYDVAEITLKFNTNGTGNKSYFISQICGYLMSLRHGVLTETTTVRDASIELAKFTEEARKYIVKDYATPQMYGAVGDGEADDTNAIQNCINANRIIFFPKGTYRITAPLELPAGKTLYGDNNYSTTIFCDKTDGFHFKANAERVTIRDLSFREFMKEDTYKTAKSNDFPDGEHRVFTFAKAVVLCVFDNVWTRYFSGATFWDNGNGFINNIYIQNCTLEHGGNNAIELIGQPASQINDVVIRNTNVTYFKNDGICISGCNITVENCSIQACRNGVRVDGTMSEKSYSNSLSKGINISNNYFEMIRQSYIWCNAECNPAENKHCTIVGMSISCNQGIYDNAPDKDENGNYYPAVRFTLVGNNPSRYLSNIGYQYIGGVIYTGNVFDVNISKILIDGRNILYKDSVFVTDAKPGSYSVLGSDGKGDPPYYLTNMGTATVISRYQKITSVVKPYEFFVTGEHTTTTEQLVLNPSAVAYYRIKRNDIIYFKCNCAIDGTSTNTKLSFNVYLKDGTVQNNLFNKTYTESGEIKLSSGDVSATIKASMGDIDSIDVVIKAGGNTVTLENAVVEHL